MQGASSSSNLSTNFLQFKKRRIKLKWTNKQTPQNGKESLSLLSRSHLMCSVFVTRETIYVLNNTVIWRGKNPSHLGNTTNFSAGKNQASGFLILDQTRLRSKSCNLAIPCSGDMAVRDVAVGKSKDDTRVLSFWYSAIYCNWLRQQQIIFPLEQRTVAFNP